MKGLGTRLQSPFFGMFCFINADVLFPNKLTHPLMHRLYFDISPILLNVFLWASRYVAKESESGGC